jgi:hypothetical protein
MRDIVLSFQDILLTLNKCNQYFTKEISKNMDFGHFARIYYLRIVITAAVYIEKVVDIF